MDQHRQESHLQQRIEAALSHSESEQAKDSDGQNMRIDVAWPPEDDEDTAQ